MKVNKVNSAGTTQDLSQQVRQRGNRKSDSIEGDAPNALIVCSEI